MNLQEFNALPSPTLASELEKCCGSSNWINAMLAARPYSSASSILEHSNAVWSKLGEDDFLEAFNHHPKIGDTESLKKRFRSTADWAGEEQKGAKNASISTLNTLKQANNDYLQRFGFIFIVCATGKSAPEMLSLLQLRLGNDRQTELAIAAAEQDKITTLRLNKLLKA